MAKQAIGEMIVATVYPLYVAKAQWKGRKKAEVDEIIRWTSSWLSCSLCSTRSRLPKSLHGWTFASASGRRA